MDQPSASNVSVTRLSPTDDGNTAHVRLACQACQRKKIKCDRTFPCGQCTKSSLECVPSSRKQRTRHVGRRAVDGELRNRIAKLESLVESLSGDVGDKQSPGAEASVTTPPAPQARPVSHMSDLDSPTVGKYVANTFWASMTTEFAAIREALEEDDDQDDETPGDTPSGQTSTPDKSSGTTPYEHDLIFCPPGRIYVMPGVMEDLSMHIQTQLNAYFLSNVERMLKVFHRPTIQALLENDAPYLGHMPGSTVHDALKRVAWFSAVNSLTEAECVTLFNQSKNDVLPKFRRYVEILLSQCDLINTTDLATMQIFMLFLAVCRTTDASRRTWTLIATLVRIGQAMYLHRDDIRATPFIRENRRRLWHYIRFLDKFSSLDRGSIPIIRVDEHNTPLPINTDDALFGPESKEIPEVVGRACDMSFAIMCLDACSTLEALIVPEFSPAQMTWEERYAVAQELGKKVNEQYLIFCDLSDPWQQLQHAIGKSMSTAMLLRAVRPLQCHASSRGPPINSPYVLQLAVDNLTAVRAISVQPNAEAWRWMRWVPWHSVAVALAGLCSIRDTPLADRAWELVEPAYRFSSQHVADSEGGMLWKPIAKLYKKACAYRDGGPARQQSLSSTMSKVEPAPAAQSMAAGTNGLYIGNAQSGAAYTLAAGVDLMTNNFTNLMPFRYPAVFPNTLQTTGQDYANSDGFNLMPNYGDVGWTDWNQVMDEYTDPLSFGNTMDVDTSMSNWNWSGSINSGPGMGGL